MDWMKEAKQVLWKPAVVTTVLGVISLVAVGVITTGSNFNLANLQGWLLSTAFIIDAVAAVVVAVAYDYATKKKPDWKENILVALGIAVALTGFVTLPAGGIFGNGGFNFAMFLILGALGGGIGKFIADHI